MCFKTNFVYLFNSGVIPPHLAIYIVLGPEAMKNIKWSTSHTACGASTDGSWHHDMVLGWLAPALAGKRGNFGKATSNIKYQWIQLWRSPLNVTMEHQHFWWENSVFMIIFNNYDIRSFKLPEGKLLEEWGIWKFIARTSHYPKMRWSPLATARH